MKHCIMMIPLFLSLFSFFLQVSCQTPERMPAGPALKEVTALPKELNECSGMILLNNNTFAGLNDGGNKAMLYVFNLRNQDETRKIKIDSVINHDWEELTSDDEYIYIGDTGNNGGTRQNLMVYKIKIDDVLAGNEVLPEKIRFSYESQTKFNDSNRHNFDCESMVSIGDSLYLFSKNRGDLRTDLYSIPNTPGNYKARKLGSFNAMGLITGADYRTVHGKGELVLVGYDLKDHVYSPFLLHFTSFRGRQFFTGNAKRIIIDRKLQAESVLFHDINTVYISNESTKKEKGYIYAVNIAN